MLILRTLALQSMHGYGIAQHIHRLSNEVIQVEEGSLYPALYRMVQKGWIKGEWGISENNRRAKFYRLTAGGRAQLNDETPTWLRHAEAIARALRPETPEIAS